MILRLSKLTVGGCLCYGASSLRAQLVFNEISQGTTGSQEYVELLVIDTGGCSACVDIRGWIIDDNNGWHVSPIGPGQGIAPGCMRFSFNPQWECVPVGTIILVYNNGDKNPIIPADDPTDANNDCVYIIPGNSTLLDRNDTEPNNTGLINYSSITFINGGSWTTTSMLNTDDSYQVTNPNNTSEPYFSIGWGNNTLLQNVYFAGSVSGEVIYMANTNNNNPFDASNWVNLPASGNQTPGTPNNAANTTWISGLSNNCNPPTIPVVAIDSVKSTSCAGVCDGKAWASASSGISPYTFQWSTSPVQTGTSATGLCAGNYNVTVTDANLCNDTLSTSLTITQPAPLTALVSKGIAPCPCPCPGHIYLFPSGGTQPYTFNWSNGYTDQFQTGLCVGTYNVTVTDSNGCIYTALVTLP